GRWRTLQLLLQHDATTPHDFEASLEPTSSRWPSCHRRRKVAAGLSRKANSAICLVADEADAARQPVHSTLGAPCCIGRRLPNGGIPFRGILHLLRHEAVDATFSLRKAIHLHILSTDRATSDDHTLPIWARLRSARSEPVRHQG